MGMAAIRSTMWACLRIFFTDKRSWDKHPSKFFSPYSMESRASMSFQKTIFLCFNCLCHSLVQPSPALYGESIVFSFGKTKENWKSLENLKKMMIKKYFKKMVI
jgi:hypothetical protein